MFAVYAVGVVLVAIAFGIFVNTRWAGERGWVYNKHNRRPSGSGGTVGIFEEMFQPGIEHVVDERSSEQQRREVEDSGPEQ